MKSLFKTCLLTLWALSMAGPAVAQPMADLPDDVVEVIAARVDGGRYVGVVVGIVTAEGPRYYSYGSTTLSGDQAIDEHTVFEIGSITKVFTAILLADMAQRGEVALDDPIASYLPDSVGVPTRGDQVMTLAHLSTHMSGLPRMPTNFAPAQPWNPFADYTVAQLYDFLGSYTLPRDVGAQYEYSNYGVGLLGHLLARHHGTSYEALVAERITGVLGMDETAITLTPALQERLATGHAGRFAVANWDFTTLAGAGALRSTARDMLRFLAANLGLEASPLDEAMSLSHQPRVTRPDGMQVGLAPPHPRRPDDRLAQRWHRRLQKLRRLHLGRSPGRGGADQLEPQRKRPRLSPARRFLPAPKGLLKFFFKAL